MTSGQIANHFAAASTATGIDLLAYDRRPHVVAARDAAIQAAHADGATRQQIAKFMGRDWSSINRSIRKATA